MNILDQTWQPFTNLMLQHIFNVLLVCTDYDRFLIEKDGRIEEQLFYEYTNLGLTSPPKISHASNADQALDMLGSRKFEMVIMMLDITRPSMTVLAETVKQKWPDISLIVLSPAPSKNRSTQLKAYTSENPIDQLFYWQGDPNLFLAMIKLVEDQINLDHDTQAAPIEVILLVEDSVRFYSSFLPSMYTALIRQNSSSIMEGLNRWGKSLRMRARPKIVLAKTYDEATRCYEKYESHILGIISDASYNKDNIPDGRAGLELCEELRRKRPDLPFLIQSTDRSIEAEAREAGAAFLWKLSPSLLDDLDNYMLGAYGFGPFIFRDPKSGMELMRAVNIKELQEEILKVPDDCFAYHVKRNDFSRWLRARSLFSLSEKLRPLGLPDPAQCQALKIQIFETIKNYRSYRNRGVIADFSETNFDESSFFCRVGKGSLGGKGRGLAFLDAQIKQSTLEQDFPDIEFSIPKTIVLTADIFSEYMEENHLYRYPFATMDDGSILKIFLSSPLQKGLVENLKTILGVMKRPLSIRSSSLLEDSFYQPFAGVYETCMIRNQGSLDQRIDQISDAIRTVYASTFFQKSRDYLKATKHIMEEEKMSVVIQQITGAQHGSYFYPNISGVAKSVNYYPFEGEARDEGIALLCFGFGKSVVENISAFRMCPKHPGRQMDKRRTQTSFFALDMTDSPSHESMDNLTSLDISKASPDSLRLVASTLDSLTHEMTDDPGANGPKFITFNPIIKYNAFPLASLINGILDLGAKSMDCPVEIEFAVNLEAPKPQFTVLQLRPIVERFEQVDVQITESDRQNALIYSKQAMGCGVIKGVRDIITIRPETFDLKDSLRMCDELSEFNSKLGCPYLLIVSGRLGSSDRWLGIPVGWGAISNAAVIVEASLPGINAEPSQGSHFFQNLTGEGVIYITCGPNQVRFSTISNLKAQEETQLFRHIHLEEDLLIKVDGRKAEAAIILQ
jgi:hypothetical protein